MFRLRHGFAAALMAALLLPVGLLALAPDAAGARSEDSILQATEAPLLAATPRPGAVLFRDDFHTHSGRWVVSDDEHGVIAYRSGALHVTVPASGGNLWSVPDFSVPLGDYRLEVLAALREGGPETEFGLVLDYVDETRFDAWVVSPRGRWRWLRWQDGEWHDLTPGDAAPFEVQIGVGVLRLRADVMADATELYVNGFQVGTLILVRDPGDRLGVIALAGERAATIAFDDVVLTNLAGRGRGR